MLLWTNLNAETAEAWEAFYFPNDDDDEDGSLDTKSDQQIKDATKDNRTRAERLRDLSQPKKRKRKKEFDKGKISWGSRAR
jgi:hypothetical protein